MFPLAALVAGGLDLAGDLVSNTNARSAFKTRYQDTVADIKKAGLNPALAYGQGGGSPQTNPIGDVGSSAVEGSRAAQNAKQMAAQTRLTNAQASLLEQQTKDILRSTSAKASTDELRQHGQIFKNISTEARSFMDQLESRIREATSASDTRTRLSRNDLQLIETQLARLSLPQQRAVAKYFEGPLGRNEGNIDKILDVIRAIAGFQKGDRSFTTNNYIRGTR